MRTISIINLKGGCAKTLSSVNIAHILAFVYGKKVLLIDNDKQGDASKILNCHSYEHPGTAEILTERNIRMSEVIQHTSYEGLGYSICQHEPADCQPDSYVRPEAAAAYPVQESPGTD